MSSNGKKKEGEGEEKESKRKGDSKQKPGICENLQHKI